MKKREYVQDKGRKAVEFLRERYTAAAEDDDLVNRLKILRFIQDIEPKDVAPRVFGEFKSLVGRVWKEFDREIHVVEAFKVPTDWPVVCQVDFHLGKPHAMSFYTVNQQGIYYVIDEVWENMATEEVADEIIRRKHENTWRLDYAEIDPLSKGDDKYMKNRMGPDIKDSFGIIQSRLRPFKIRFNVASKDEKSGIRNIESWLKGPNGIPLIYFFDTLQSAHGEYGHLWEIQRWVYDDDGKPKDENDHFCETLYRLSLMGLKYTKPVRLYTGPRQRAKAGAWMGV